MQLDSSKNVEYTSNLALSSNFDYINTFSIEKNLVAQSVVSGKSNKKSEHYSVNFNLGPNIGGVNS